MARPSPPHIRRRSRWLTSAAKLLFTVAKLVAQTAAKPLFTVAKLLAHTAGEATVARLASCCVYARLRLRRLM